MEHQQFNSKVTHYSGIVYKGDAFGAHFHNSFELIYIMKGRAFLTVGGRVVTLEEKELILISPCVVHEMNRCEETVYFIAIITPDYISDYWETHKSEIAVRFHIDKDAHVFVNKMLIEGQDATTYQLKSCFYLLLSFAEKGIALLPAEDQDVSFVYRINAYIAEHLTEKILRKDLALVMGYEEHYFSLLFRKNFGMGIRKYLNLCRISYACRLLKTTNKTVLSIALDSGFGGVREFNTVFAQMMGQAPMEYRKIVCKKGFNLV